MEPRIEVHERIHAKRSDISEADVRAAWKSRVKCQMRVGPWPTQYAAVGFDGKGRILQMVATYSPVADEVLIFHVMTVTGNVKKELGLD